MWLDRADKWPVLAGKLRGAGEFGLDTETYGQPDGTSPQYRARVHCWSVAWLVGSPSPRGHRRAAGVVLPVAALECPDLRAVLADASVGKWAHNAPHDHHALVNEGLQVRGMVDTLQWLRVAVPGRQAYGLKDAERWALGKPGRPGFMHLMAWPRLTEKRMPVVTTRCACGARPCRKRSTSTWVDEAGVAQTHTRLEEITEKVTTGYTMSRYAVPDFVPGSDLSGHMWGPGDKLLPVGRRVETLPATQDRWAAWVQYALADAVSAMELVDWLRGRPAKVPAFPWSNT